MMPDISWSEKDGPDIQPTAGVLVLCGYRVYSASAYHGSAQGAVMVRVERMDDIVDEFEVKMRQLQRHGAKHFGVDQPSRWNLLWYLPYSGAEKF